MMRLFDTMVGLKLPRPGLAPVLPGAVLAALLALDRATAPFSVRLGSGGKDGDVTAEWRLADPRWHPVFDGRVAEDLSIALWLHRGEAQVRCLQRGRGVTWTAGRPVPARSWSQVRGAYSYWSRGVPPAFIETTAAGDRIGYQLEPSEVRRPLEAAVTGQGWSFRGVGFGSR